MEWNQIELDRSGLLIIRIMPRSPEWHAHKEVEEAKKIGRRCINP